MTEKNSSEGEVRRGAITSQIIVLALAAGVVAFGAIAFSMGPMVEPGDQPIITYVFAGFAVMMAPARLLVPSLFASQNRRAIAAGTWRPSGGAQAAPRTERGKFATICQTKVIVGSALLEGAAFANLIAYMIEGQMLSAVISVLLLFGILLGLPTPGRFTAWVDHEQRLF